MLSYTLHHLRQQTLPSETQVPQVRTVHVTHMTLYPNGYGNPQRVQNPRVSIWWPYFSVALVIWAALKDVPVTMRSRHPPLNQPRHYTDWILDGMPLITDRGTCYRKDGHFSWPDDCNRAAWLQDLKVIRPLVDECRLMCQ
jgi:hypothetical protein